MTQGDVIAWLKAHPGWHRTADIVEGLNQGYKGVRSCLAKAASWRDIESRRSGFRKEWGGTHE